MSKYSDRVLQVFESVHIIKIVSFDTPSENSREIGISVQSEIKRRSKLFLPKSTGAQCNSSSISSKTSANKDHLG